MPDFTGSVALVTGGGAGIGRETARTLTAAGARVAVLDRDGEAAADAAAELGADRTLPLTADVTDAAQVRAAVDEVVGRWGRIDLLHNHAGVLAPGDGSILDVDESTFRDVIGVNVVGQFIVGQQVAQHMAAHGGGAIVNTASDLSFIALPGVCAYVTSKTAIAGLTRAMAADLAAHRIRVNAVCPGFVSTAMTAPLERDPAALAAMRADYLVPELGVPADVAGVVAFLLSDAARFMTGSLVLVDGGHTVR
jgi:NAD(P)-dependent dehydrogenase (short-subunit alcohol dehydrogenase family)